MKKKILFVYTNYSTFVKTDFEILSSFYHVEKYQYKPVYGLVKVFFELLKQLIFLLLKGRQFNAAFIWFAGYHSFLPVLFFKFLNKKSYIVIGGYDVVSIPELKYGAYRNKVSKFFTYQSQKMATLNLPVVENLEYTLNKINPKAKTFTIYTGYELPESESLNFNQVREKILLTVSYTDTKNRAMIKGLDRFRELANVLQDFTFIIIGITNEVKTYFVPLPKNLLLIPPLPAHKIAEYYYKASFYAQFSRSEGLPNSLCEAMLHGCVPLGTNVGGISAAIKHYGLILDDWDISAASDFIIENHNKINRIPIHQHIMKNFRLEFRKTKLENLPV